MKQAPLREVDSAEVLCLVDNVSDVLLAGSESVRRSLLRGEGAPSEPAALMEGGQTAMMLRAEHGFSALITSHAGGRSRSILLDTGMTPGCVVHNMRVLRLTADPIETVVLSHGHPDHTVGLSGLADMLGGRAVPLLLNPDAWLERRIALRQNPVPLARLDRQALLQAGFQVTERREPTPLLDGTVLVSGEVERTTDFEIGLPLHEAKRGGEWVPDPEIFDDQAVVLNVRHKGLVVVTGCGHAGVINTLRHACKITGVDRVHAVIGGFHLNGPLYDPLIPLTIDAMRDFAPDVIVPTHCTGWKAIHAFAAAMPDAFVQNSVGTTYVF